MLYFHAQQNTTSCLHQLWAGLTHSSSNHEITELAVTEEHVHDVLYKIDSMKACGPDHILRQLLKEGAPWLVEHLSMFLNLLITMGSLVLPFSKGVTNT